MNRFFDDMAKHDEELVESEISYRLCIVIPCFNEAGKLKSNLFTGFVNKYPKVLLCFVNDGSTDKTLERLVSIRQGFENNIIIIDSHRNQGKAEAVRMGMNYCLEKTDGKIYGYLDADLAVSLEECRTLSSYLKKDISFCFGSRILKIGSVIERKPSRFFIGRVMATFISELLHLKVYDTQCGCKLFRRALALKVFQEPFISRWLFDVEIFFRILQEYGKEKAISKMLEIPVRRWIDQGDSKVKPGYFFRMMIDLFKIRKKYRQTAGLE